MHKLSDMVNPLLNGSSEALRKTVQGMGGSRETGSTAKVSEGDYSTPNTPALSESLIERLWGRMASIYGHRWVSSYGANPQSVTGQTWAKGLAGVAASQVGAGIDRCLVEARDWPPTLPEFRAMCLGVPSFASVAEEVRGNADPSPFGRLVWSKLDSFNLRRMDAKEAEREIRRAYELARDHVMAGKPLPPTPVAAIESKPAPIKPASREVARAALDAIAATLKVTPQEDTPNAR